VFSSTCAVFRNVSTLVLAPLKLNFGSLAALEPRAGLRSRHFVQLPALDLKRWAFTQAEWVVRSSQVDAWTFIWLMVLLKIPIVALFLLVRWAVRQTPESASDEDGGISTRSRPHPHPHPRLPRTPRRGPHGDPSPCSPPRARPVVARGRFIER
jgi:hypothetical protein